jgi:gamma-glutamyl:cysteine ligase YbdK (ATP-grasp superfamily)
MALSSEAFTMGVEEEYQIIDPQTRQLRSKAQSILRKAQVTLGDQVTQELYLSQIEIGTSFAQRSSRYALNCSICGGRLSRLPEAPIAASWRQVPILSPTGRISN